MAKQKRVTTADKLAAILAAVAPDLDVEEEVQYVAVKSDGSLTYRLPKGYGENEEDDDDGENEEDEDDDENEEDDDGENEEDDDDEDDDDGELSRKPPSRQTGRQSHRQRKGTQAEKKETKNTGSKKQPNLDPKSDDYDWEADIDQWVSGGGQ